MRPPSPGRWRCSRPRRHDERIDDDRRPRRPPRALLHRRCLRRAAGARLHAVHPAAADRAARPRHGRGRAGLHGARPARRHRLAARVAAALDRAAVACAEGPRRHGPGQRRRARADGRALGRDAAVPRRSRLHRRRRLPRHCLHPQDRLPGLLRQGDAARHRRRLGAGRLRRADQLRPGHGAAEGLRARRLRRHRRDPGSDGRGSRRVGHRGDGHRRQGASRQDDIGDPQRIVFVGVGVEQRASFAACGASSATNRRTSTLVSTAITERSPLAAAAFHDGSRRRPAAGLPRPRKRGFSPARAINPNRPSRAPPPPAALPPCRSAPR